MPNTHPCGCVVLSTLNATYLHTSLALRTLLAYNRPRTGLDICIMEFTINQPLTDIMAALYQQRPAVLAFSCYIWNIESILKLCDDYKKADPDTAIVLGGPAVSYDAIRVLEQNPGVDYIVCGEGEVTLTELLAVLAGEQAIDAVLGIAYRDPGGQPCSNPPRPLMTPLDDLPFPYDCGIDELTDRLVYYESSRGCPFRCSYCLSSAHPGVRLHSLERVKSDLDLIMDLPLREIKFVDRTFNLDERRARAIMEHILSHPGQTQVHFEIDAGLLSDGMLDFLATLPPGRFNFEIGVQSTYPPALQAVGRKQDWERLSRNITRLVANRNLHIHLDLIAGLPGEDLASFKNSFNMVYNLRPDMLQLGFLKILQGSPLAQECASLGFEYQSHPPYQVISNPHLKFEDILILTRIESLLDRYYNSGQMAASMDYITTVIYARQPADFYHELADYWNSNAWWGRGHRKESLYSYIYRFICDQHSTHCSQVEERLKYDYLLHHHRYTLPDGLVSRNPANLNDLLYAYTRDKDFVHRYLPGWEGRTAREIKKLLHLEYLKLPGDDGESRDVQLMFVYHPVTLTAIQVLDLSGDVPVRWDLHKKGAPAAGLNPKAN